MSLSQHHFFIKVVECYFQNEVDHDYLFAYLLKIILFLMHVNITFQNMLIYQRQHRFLANVKHDLFFIDIS